MHTEVRMQADICIYIDVYIHIVVNVIHIIVFDCINVTRDLIGYDNLVNCKSFADYARLVI